MERIRNFSIIAHIDHGKSTLADRILELTGAVDPRTTCPSCSTRWTSSASAGSRSRRRRCGLPTTAADGETYDLQLIDTPGHVDFSYEVSRSLAACEGALLVVDAAQGVEAQTVANTYAAIDAGLELIPVLNKVDLPSAEPERVAAEIVDLIGGTRTRSCACRQRPGRGWATCSRQSSSGSHRRRATRRRRRAPSSSTRSSTSTGASSPTCGSSTGGSRKRERIVAMQAGTEADIDEIGFFAPKMPPAPGMGAGEVGYVITGIKDVAKLRVGDTLTGARPPGVRGAARLPRGQADGLLRALPDRHRPLRGPARRARAAGPQRRRALVRARDLGRARVRLPLRLPRPAAHGHRPRATRARIRPRAAGDDAQRPLRGGAPLGGELVEVRSPTDMPDPASIERIAEPYIRATIITPAAYVGRDHGALPGPARRPTSTFTTYRRSASRSATTCRWRRSCSTSTTSSSRARPGTRRSTTSRSGTATPTS